jgi:hypothetical protein
MSESSKQQDAPGTFSRRASLLRRTERKVPTTYEYPLVHEYSNSASQLRLNSTELIEEHLQQIRSHVEAHTIASMHYEQWNRRMGYPVAIISGFLASTLMMNFSADQDSDAVRMINLALSFILFIMSATQNYLKYEKLSQSHDTSAKLYTTLLRGVEVRLLAEDIEKSERRDIFKDIVEQMSIIEQFEYPVPEWVLTKLDKRAPFSRSMAINVALMNDEEVVEAVRLAGRRQPSVGRSPLQFLTKKTPKRDHPTTPADSPLKLPPADAPVP